MTSINNYTMTAQEVKFCNQFLIDFNPVLAAIRVGYMPEESFSVGYELLSRPEVQEHIHETQSEFLGEIHEDVSKAAGVTRSHNIVVLSEIAYMKPLELRDSRGITYQSVSPNYTGMERIEAVKELNRMCGFYPLLENNPHASPVVEANENVNTNQITVK